MCQVGLGRPPRNVTDPSSDETLTIRALEDRRGLEAAPLRAGARKRWKPLVAAISGRLAHAMLTKSYYQ
jgi:hypothetical protein